MELNKLLELIANESLTIENYFMAGKQRFVNLCATDDANSAQSVEVSDDLKEMKRRILSTKEKIHTEKNLQLLQISGKKAPMVMVDLAPYKSMIDGSMITSRSQHREHLKKHGCIEVGNETKHLKPNKVSPPPGLKEELINQVYSKLRYK